MKQNSLRFLFLLFAAIALATSSCNHIGSKLNEANFDKIHDGMSKSQVESILGAPTTTETKDMLIFKKTTYRWEDGKNFASVTFKNDEVDGKETNLKSQH
jgi:hypothetical protein